MRSCSLLRKPFFYQHSRASISASLVSFLFRRRFSSSLSRSCPGLCVPALSTANPFFFSTFLRTLRALAFFLYLICKHVFFSCHTSRYSRALQFYQFLHAIGRFFLCLKRLIPTIIPFRRHPCGASQALSLTTSSLQPAFFLDALTCFAGLRFLPLHA